MKKHIDKFYELAYTNLQKQRDRKDSTFPRPLTLNEEGNTVRPTNQSNGCEETVNYHRTNVEKEIILERLKESGCRITKQRKILLDIILNEECASCKEIYYKAVQSDPGIGVATVYRMINLLEETGAISRKNMYRVSCPPEGKPGETEGCRIELDDHSVCCLSGQNWNTVILEGLKACGYIDKQKINRVVFLPEIEKNFQ